MQTQKATCFLLDKINSINHVHYIPSIELEDYYKDSIILLVLDKTNCSQIQGFNLNDYVVSLYKQGYSFSGRGNLSSIIEKSNKRLNLVSCSRELVQIGFISNLFKKSIPIEREEFAKFYTYYQIVEILISVVFDCKFKKFVNDLYLNKENLFDKKDELSEMTSEKRRVSWLFANHVRIQRRDEDILNELCKKILRKYQKNISKVCSDNLYAIRCLLVHRMYMLDGESYETLNELNVVF